MLTLVLMSRIVFLLFLAIPLWAQCRLSDPAPDFLDKLPLSELLDSGHYLRAARKLESAITEARSDGRRAWLLSRAKAALGDLDSAMKLAETALASDETNPAYHVQVAAVAGRMAEKASLLKRLSLAARARKELEAAAALDPKNPDAQWGLMMFYYAVPSLIGGDKLKAQEIGERLALAMPDVGRYYQGRLALELKEADKAEAFFRQAALENPLLFDAPAALAKFYIETKPDPLRAERWACQAVHVDSSRAEAWALLARTYTLCGCWTEASAIAERAEAIDPDNLVPYYTVALAAIERDEQLEMAASLLRKYISKPVEGNQPSEAYAHLQLGRALGKLGRAAQAATEFKAALEQDSSLETARTELKRLGAELKH